MKCFNIFFLSVFFALTSFTIQPLTTTTKTTFFASAEDSGEAPPTELEMEGINELLKSTTIMKILKEHADNHDRQLALIKDMVKSELEKLNKHFEGVVAEMEIKENLLQKHIASVEKRLEEKLRKSHEMADTGNIVGDGGSGVSVSHFWPYLFLFCSVLACAACGMQKINALKKEDDFYAGTGFRTRKRH
jgi:hypothetical protein